jgi:hypothetical protein
LTYRNDLLDRKQLETEAEKTSSRITEVVAALILNGTSPHGIVFGLLRVAAFIAKATGCPPETFTKLSDIAYRTVRGDTPDSGSPKPGSDIN